MHAGKQKAETKALAGRLFAAASSPKRFQAVVAAVGALLAGEVDFQTPRK